MSGPCAICGAWHSGICPLVFQQTYQPTPSFQPVITKRELFAAMAMQGFLADGDDQSPFLGNPRGRDSTVWIAEASMDYADALIAALAGSTP